MTRELLDKLPVGVLNGIERIKSEYKNGKKSETRKELSGYVRALRDVGLITERERQILFVYATI